MVARLQKHAVPIVIGVSFYTFGFFVMVNVLQLTEREIMVGLFSGAVGGLTMLAVVLRGERKSGELATDSR
jgi:hypothetical protein